MAEIAGSVRAEELNDVVDKVLENTKDRRKGNMLIKETCFDKIKEKIELSVPFDNTE